MMVQALWLTYKTLGSCSVAITFLKETIRRLILSEENSHNELDKAAILMAELKELTITARGIPDLEVELQTAIKKFGPRHVEVGEIYNTLGSAYLHAVNLQLAAENLAYGKNILDKDPVYHEDSVMLGEALSLTYKSMGSSSVAITFLEERITSLELLGATAEDRVNILKAELKKIRSDDSTNDSQSGGIPGTNKAMTWKMVLLEDCFKVQPTTTKSIHENSWNLPSFLKNSK